LIGDCGPNAFGATTIVLVPAAVVGTSGG